MQPFKLNDCTHLTDSDMTINTFFITQDKEAWLHPIHLHERLTGHLSTFLTRVFSEKVSQRIDIPRQVLLIYLSLL